MPIVIKYTIQAKYPVYIYIHTHIKLLKCSSHTQKKNDVCDPQVTFSL
jgi:hypothetical protein